MKRIILIIGAIILGGVLVWWLPRGAGSKSAETKNAETKEAAEKPKDAAEKPAAEESHVKHDEKGHVVVLMDDETQGNAGILVTKPAPAQFAPELKAYGHVLDPAALAALLTELGSVQAAQAASSNEFARLKLLVPQGNASERALQTAEAAARRDQLAVQSAVDRLVWLWGKGVAEQSDLPGFVRSLALQQTALVRLDLPAGENLKAPPIGARLITLSGDSAEAEFLGAASNVDPQTLGRGLIFLLKTNAARLLAGETLTGYLKLPGDPLNGVIVPTSAVVRSEGSAWVYVLNKGGAAFTRMPVSLDHPLDAGWFVSQGVDATNYLVTTGAQILLSEELKATIKAD